jgi:hypothetical protein
VHHSLVFVKNSTASPFLDMFIDKYELSATLAIFVCIDVLLLFLSLFVDVAHLLNG